jgi:hypothetical protein
MRNKILVGGTIFLVLIVSQAPVGIVQLLIPENASVNLINTNGTLWSGQGQLLINRQPIGTISWDLQGVTMLQGKVSYAVRAENQDQNLTAELMLLPDSGIRAGNGTIDAAAINRWLAPYNMQLSGQFSLDDVALLFENGRPTQAGGEVHWAGGPVTYTLAGETSTGLLPEMTAVLGPHAAAVVYASTGQTPLLHAELQENGFARIGVTKLLTKMLNRPWPGNDADHAVVLEVEEQVF